MTLRVLLLHNFYQRPGGEDQVYASEATLLERAGHEVLRYSLHNDSVAELNPARLATRAVWSIPAYREIRALCRRHRPHVAHFHNTLPLISPAGHHAAKAEGVPVVQTLHNYRLACPAGTFFRDGFPCEDCIGRQVPLPAIAHRCYRDSRAASAAIAASISVHRLLGRWKSSVDRYIALTEFARAKFIQCGVPAQRISLKPNFVDPDPGTGSHMGNYALFVGRLSPEKGVRTLLAAWRLLNGLLPLRIIGSGPLENLRKPTDSAVEWVGQRERQEIFDAMRNATFLVFPSEWYETFGLTIAEAFATGLPVIASRIGTASELVQDGKTGVHFRSGDAVDLAARVRWAIENRAELIRMGEAARQEYLDRYTANANYATLMRIYGSILSPERVPEPGAHRAPNAV